MGPKKTNENGCLAPSIPTPVVVGAGLVSLDIVVNGDPHQPIGHWAGGTCGNVLAALGFLGWSALPVARLGEDVAGDMVMADLKTHGVQTDLMEREAGRDTAKIVQRIFTKAGKIRHRFAFECPACAARLSRYRPARLDRYDVVLQMAPAPRLFFFDRISPLILRLAEAYRAAGAFVVFEPGKVGDPEAFARAVQASHVVKYSAERLGRALAAMGGIRKLAGGTGPGLEVETHGAAGLRYRFGLPEQETSRWRKQAAYSVPNLRDTAGAGDWCTAGLVYSLLDKDGQQIDQVLQPERVHNSLRRAQAMSAISCMFEGPRALSYALSRKALLDVVSDLAGASASSDFVAESPEPTAPSNDTYTCSTCLA